MDFLDSVAPWGKQHVFLYHGPRNDLQAWKDPDSRLGLLKQHRLGKLFNARLPLILPEKAHALVGNSCGRNVARHGGPEARIHGAKRPSTTRKRKESGERIILRAYMHHLTRTLAAFEWDLNANVAMLQITQLQRDGDYEKVAEQLSQLVQPWLDMKQFGACRPPSGHPQASRD